jgi:hypothetical protein
MKPLALACAIIFLTAAWLMSSIGQAGQAFKGTLAAIGRDGAAQAGRVGGMGVGVVQHRGQQRAVIGIGAIERFQPIGRVGDQSRMGKAKRQDRRLAQPLRDVAVAGPGQKRLAGGRRRPGRGDGKGGSGAAVGNLPVLRRVTEQGRPPGADRLAPVAAQIGIGDPAQNRPQPGVECGAPFGRIEPCALGLARQTSSTGGTASSMAADMAAAPPVRIRSSGSWPEGSKANRRLLPASSIGSARSITR